MFKKLVSNLPFSPQIINQLAFYGKRLARENATRRLVVVFSILAMGLQVFSFVVPAERTNASSSNDLVTGGLNRSDPKGHLLQVYDSGGDVRALFNEFGIEREHIQRTFIDSLGSSSDVLSIGRTPHAGDVATIHAGGTTFYQRPLSVWGSFNSQVLHGSSPRSGEFWVMIDCGNLVTRHPPTPPPPPPQHPRIHIIKDAITNPPVMVEEAFNYRIVVKNIGDVALENVLIADVLPEHIVPVTPLPQGVTYDAAARKVTWPRLDRLVVGQEVTRTLKVKSTVSVKLDTDLKNIACVTTNFNPTLPICDDALVKIRKEGVPVLSKKVGNLSRDPGHPEYIDANNSTVHAGETLQYTLFVKNPGSIKISDYTVEDNIKDILEYADVIDSGGGKVENGIIRWTGVDIKPGEEIAKIFKVKIKDPVPNTPVSQSDPLSFDLCLDNVFGDSEITVCIDKPVVKAVEETAAELPNTGISLNIILTTLFVGAVTYFFMRNRQLIKEISIIKHEQSGGA